ncbi:hypothetical protein ATN88_07525 [Enterovibrio coralii]|uniref:Peptidase U32 n=2 Tax=Enterovibrio coralii TaxID=294935 RepID=A0A135I521_9GAMM|nr:hypothetical protein ATN88_07525 [Enterovibrio coralii]
MDNSLIDGLQDTNVVQVFGKMTNDCIGGGLENHLISKNTQSRDVFEQHVKHVREKGLTFNYTFNAPSLMNKEYTLSGKREIRELLDYITEVGVNEVTVANYFLIDSIKKHYPELDVKISATMQVDNLSKARKFEDMGVDCIVLDPMQVNRDFETLSAIREGTDCDLELIVNNNCLWQCPVLSAHQTFLGHSSQLGENKEVSHDYIYIKRCAQERIYNKEAWIIADWIRPEDLHYYEKIGYDFFKIIDRATPQDVMIKRAKAYSERHFDGNLLELIQHWGYRDLVKPEEYLDNIYVDNRKLDKFLKFITRMNCRDIGCGTECKHCFKFAEKSVSIKQKIVDKFSAAHSSAIKEIEYLNVE